MDDDHRHVVHHDRRDDDYSNHSSDESLSDSSDVIIDVIDLTNDGSMQAIDVSVVPSTSIKRSKPPSPESPRQQRSSQQERVVLHFCGV